MMCATCVSAQAIALTVPIRAANAHAGEAAVPRAPRPGPAITTAHTANAPTVRVAATRVATVTTGRPHRTSAPGSTSSFGRAAPVNASPATSATRAASRTPSNQGRARLLAAALLTYVA